MSIKLNNLSIFLPCFYCYNI